MSKRIKEVIGEDIAVYYPDKKISVITPRDFEDQYPIFCPVCEKSMNARIDEIYYGKFECCADCGMKWAEVNRSKWKEGWRPSRDNIKEEIKNRR